jgi:DNA excision repair protein ERCC-2
MKTQLAVGVRELVEHVLRSGDLVMEFTGSSRAAEAVRIHQRIQYSRPDGYLPEVSVSRRVESEDFVLKLAAGSTACSPAPARRWSRRSRPPPQPGGEVFARQPAALGCQGLCAFCMASTGHRHIGVQLTYARLDTGATRECRRQFTLTELAAFFDELVARYLRWASAITRWRLSAIPP